MTTSQVYLVIPTIRDLSFLSDWGSAFIDCHLLIVEDRAEKTAGLPHSRFKSITHLCWQDIRRDFGNDEWIFSRHNAGIRSYGFWKAYKAGADVIITLDDDCFPTGDPNTFVQQHLDNLGLKAPEKWFATYPDPAWMFTRGFPYKIRQTYPVMVSHGLWSGALDLDGKTESVLPKLLAEKSYPPLRQFVPFGYYYPMCSMNLAFRREAVPLMFFPMMGKDPQGNDWGYDRYDDIWAGIVSKKVMDHLQWMVVNGSPQINHRKQSQSLVNSKKEESGMLANESLWEHIDSIRLTGETSESCCLEIARCFCLESDSYLKKVGEAMNIWIHYLAAIHNKVDE